MRVALIGKHMSRFRLELFTRDDSTVSNVNTNRYVYVNFSHTLHFHLFIVYYFACE